MTVFKPAAESEKDPTNLVTFPEDRIILLLIAIEKSNFEVLEYLLNALCQFWSGKDFQNLIDKMSIDTSQKSLKVREIVFGSQTAHSFIQNKSLKKQNQWLSDMVHTIISSVENYSLLL